MPLLHKKVFEPKQLLNEKTNSLNDDVFYLKMTNEVFDTHEEYFERVILCNSLVWGCSLTGKSGLTFQESVDSEKMAAKSLSTISHGLRKAIFYLVSTTRRGRVLDICDDIFSYTREHYFHGEIVMGVIGNMWCQSTVLRVVQPTPSEIEEYKRDQIEKGEFDNNDYLKDVSWGPPPDLFKYEVSEIDPDNPEVEDVFVLESVDVKREKHILTRDKCRYLVKLNTYYDETVGYWKIKEEVSKYYELSKITFENIFIGGPPIFEQSINKPQVKSLKKLNNSKTISNHNTSTTTPTNSNNKKNDKSLENSADKKNKTKKLKVDKKQNQIKKKDTKPKGVDVTPVQLSPTELKQIEIAKRLQEREKLKINKKLIADFKKLWFKPKEDLLVEDLKDLPDAEPINCKIPNNLFGDYMMILEYCHCYSSVIKIRDYFPNGLTFESLEKILYSNEIAGPFSELLQLLLKAIFRFQIDEEYDKIIEVNHNNEFYIDTAIELNLSNITKYNNNVYNWSKLYQNTPLNRLPLDHLTLNEILRLHLLSSGANSMSEESKWRYQQRGSYVSTDDPGLELILNTDIINTLNHGNIFELNLIDRIKLITCLINQILTYTSIRESMDENMESFKKARNALKFLQAAERKCEMEDNLWKQRIKIEKAIPDLSVPKPKIPIDVTDSNNSNSDTPPVLQPMKNELTEDQIEYEIIKKEKEIEKRKNSFHNNHFELSNNLHKYEKKLGVHPIGRDRGFRRYWVFSSFPGLFVENDDEHLGECNGPTPIINNVNVNDITFVKTHFDKLKLDDENLNNKENSTIKITKINKSSSTSQQPQPIQICNGNNKTCRIHSKLNQASPKWSFYSNEQQINELINNLTPRGVRESELKKFLSEEKDGLIQLLSKCPKYKLNFKYPSEPNLVGERKSNRIKNALDPNLNFPSGTSINKICELQVRDLILEMEDKIFLGALGSIKVNDRLEWRSNIESRKYNPMVDHLYWGISKSNTLAINELPTPLPLRSADTDYRHITKDLACAILQLEQSIESKFFKKPLGIDKDEPEKKTKQKKISIELQNENNTTTNRTSSSSSVPTYLEKWEVSLMKCINFSQLFVHLFTLENSIEWTRSVLNARCRVCRRKGDGENMLLCDHCNKGHHLYCLKPQLDVIPKGDWFCIDCRPIEELKPRNQVQKKYFDKHVGGDNSDGSMDENDENDDDDEDMDTSTNIIEVCEVCKVGGEVICCDGCPSVYHLFCLNPPKTRVPRGEWLCEKCIRKKRKKSISLKKKRHSRHISNSGSDEDDDDDDDDDEYTDESNDDDDEEDDEGNSKSTPFQDSEDDENDNSEQEQQQPTKKSYVKVKFNSKNSKTTTSTTTTTTTTSKKLESEENSSSSGGSSSSSRSRNHNNDHHNTKRQENTHTIKRKSDLRIQTKQQQQRNKRIKLSTTSSDGDNNPQSPSSSGASSQQSTSSEEDDDEDDDVEKYINNRSRDSSSDPNTIKHNTRLQRNCSNKIQHHTNELDNILLDKLLIDIMKHKDAWPFLKPVTKMDAPDYHTIVSVPMDLGTIKYKLNSMVYTCNTEFTSDLHLIFDNCFQYNPPENHIFKSGEDLRIYCEKRCSQLGVIF